LKSAPRLLGGLNTPVSSQTPEQRQLQSLKDELNTLLAVLSPENPRVKVMQAQVAALEQTVAAQAAATAQVTDTGAPLSAYEIQLADAHPHPLGGRAPPDDLVCGLCDCDCHDPGAFVGDPCAGDAA